MTNSVSDGKIIKHTVSADIVSGAPLLIGDILGVACKSYLNGEEGDFAIEGCFTIAKLSTDTFVPGQILFWDAGNSRLTETASTHKPVGHSMATAGNPTSTVVLKLRAMTRDTIA